MLHLRSLRILCGCNEGMSHCRIFMERWGNMECRMVRSEWQLHGKFTYILLSLLYMRATPFDHRLKELVQSGLRECTFLGYSVCEVDCGYCDEGSERNRLSCDTATVPHISIRNLIWLIHIAFSSCFLEFLWHILKSNLEEYFASRISCLYLHWALLKDISWLFSKFRNVWSFLECSWSVRFIKWNLMALSRA
jgi:hypothetical protein